MNFNYSTVDQERVPVQMNFKQGGIKYVRKGNRTLPPPTSHPTESNS